MKENTVYPVCIVLNSSIDGEITTNNYIGEYKRMNGIHTIVFTDRTGNMITKVGVQASQDAMLLHRVGAFEGDMFFDPFSDTSVSYGTLSVERDFLLHTTRYELQEHSDGLMLLVEYSLKDNTAEPAICGVQQITITKMEAMNHEETV